MQEKALDRVITSLLSLKVGVYRNYTELCCIYYRHRQMWRGELFQWSVSNGFSSQLLMNLYVERYWETPLSDLRLRLGLTPPPCNALP